MAYLPPCDVPPLHLTMLTAARLFLSRDCLCTFLDVSSPGGLTVFVSVSSAVRLGSEGRPFTNTRLNKAEITRGATSRNVKQQRCSVVLCPSSLLSQLDDKNLGMSPHVSKLRAHLSWKQRVRVANRKALLKTTGFLSGT